MLFAPVLLAAENTHTLTAPRMKRVEDLHLKTQTPGSMTLARPVSARAGLPVRSATRPAATIAPCFISACRGCSRLGAGAR
jgi:hypothetical protein